MIQLQEQFIISDDDGITAQELFHVYNWKFLYDDVTKETINLYENRYLFIIRRFDFKTEIWSCIGLDLYIQRAAAMKKFESNKDHILMGRGYRKE